MAWLSDYTYKKKVTLTGQADAGTDYQVKLLIGKTSGATGEDFDLNEHCLDTFADIRFTDNDETTKLKYWIESVAASGTSYLATVWVKVADSLESGTPDIYIYYGKAGDTTTSSGDDTFIKYHGSTTDDFRDTVATLGTQLRFGSKSRVTANSHHVIWGISNFSVGATGQDAIYITSVSNTNVRGVHSKEDGASTGINETPKFVTNTWYRLEWLYDTTSLHGYVDGNELNTGITTGLTSADMGLTMWEIAGNGEQEWSFVAKYVSPEPAYSSAGDEETSAVGPANLKSYNGLAKASMKSIMGLAIADIKSINGLA